MSPTLRRPWLAVAALISACSAPAAPRDEPSVLDPDAAFLEALGRHRATIVADRCGDDPDDALPCAVREIPFDPTLRDPGLTDEAILVVDGFPRLPFAAFRYRGRITAYVRASATGTLDDVPHVFRVPVPFADAIAELDQAGPVPARWLEPLAEPLHDAYSEFVATDVGHGPTVFGLLVEETPRSPLVLLDGLDPTDFLSDLLCGAADDPSIVPAMRARTEALAAAIAERIEREHVRYVNYSGGWSLRILKDAWSARCVGPAPDDDELRARLATFAPIVDVLFATPGVVAAHAADVAGSPEDHPFDQRDAARPNRVRVGYFTALDSGLDAEGRGAIDAFDPWPLGAADVYLNSGVLPTRPFPYGETPLLETDDFGTSTFPLTAATTSWITPLATARLVHLRHASHADEPFDDGLVRALLDELVPARCTDRPDSRCHLQDPLRHGQTEAVRLGRRPRVLPR